MYNVLKIGVDPCADCKILGVSWNDTAKKIVYLLPYPMFVLYFLIVIKIVSMRYKVYHAKKTFSKNDQVLTLQFFILCTIQYALSYVENYFHEGSENYYGLILMSVPFLVQISNALALLLTNRLVRKALKLLIFHRSVDSQLFVKTFRNNTSKTTHVTGYKLKTAAIKLGQATMAVQAIGSSNQRNMNMYKNGSELWVTKVYF
uniref:Uncharacterized protein n=1 Tax=Acrobeloides nanus TaxID=290746 RepID=A0A914EE83_9BILA